MVITIHGHISQMGDIHKIDQDVSRGKDAR